MNAVQTKKIMVLKVSHWWVCWAPRSNLKGLLSAGSGEAWYKMSGNVNVQKHTFYRGHSHWSRLWTGWNINISIGSFVVCEGWNYGYSWQGYVVPWFLYLFVNGCYDYCCYCCDTSTITILTLPIVVLAGPGHPIRGPWQSPDSSLVETS